MSSGAEQGYIIEFYRAGGSVKVTAIDPVTGREAVAIGAPSLSDHDLSLLAVRKLEYLLSKESDN